MRPFGLVTLATTVVALSACAAPPITSNNLSTEVVAHAAPVAVTPIAPLPTDYEVLRAALPDFDLQRRSEGPASNVSVVRDLVFENNSTILSMPQVKRLAPLQTYLRANPRTTVRIEGNGDGGNSAERDTDLSMGRAQAVVRALLTDMMIANTIVAVSAPMPQAVQQSRHADITFITP
jgi:outer membrane protein OmpA-like peptidoglycan-associated protein